MTTLASTSTIDLSLFSEPERMAMKIIDEEDASALIMVRETNLRNCFLVGDIANKYVIGSTAHEMKISPTEVYRAVGRLCGKSESTVRYYCSVSMFYPVDVRWKYETLPFSFFAYAMEFGNDWERILDLAANSPQMSLSYLKNIINAERDMRYRTGAASGSVSGFVYHSSSGHDEDDGELGSMPEGADVSSYTAKIDSRGVTILCTLIGDLARRAREVSNQIDDEQLRDDLANVTRYMEELAAKISRRYVYGV